MNTASPELTNGQQQPGTRSMDRHNRSFPISELPSELLNLVLLYSLPVFNPMESCWEYDECQPYMAALFGLRYVSTLWRDLIDGTPSFWMIVSSTWSPKAIKMVLRRSGTCPLAVHHILYNDAHNGGDADEVTPSRTFLQLVNPHRSRWTSVIIELPRELVAEFFDTPLPRLDTLKISLTDEEDAVQPVIPLTPDMIDGLYSLEHVYFNYLPLQWNDVFGRLNRLRTLSLSMLHNITAEQIIEAISLNPTLETITLASLEAEVQHQPVDWALSNPTRACLPRLRLFSAEVKLDLLDAILQNIQIPHDIREIIIIPSPPSSRENNQQFWTKTMSPLFPTLHRMHKTTGGSSISLKEKGTAICTWTTVGESDDGFELCIDNWGHTPALDWIASVVNGWESPEELPGFKFLTSSGSIGFSTTFAALQTIPRMTSIDIAINSKNSHLWVFLEALGGATPKGPPSFPFLQSLRIRRWGLGFAKFIEVLKRRYTNHQPKGWRPRSNLQLDFTTRRPAWFEDPSPVIIHLEKAEELRELDGVESVRLGCLKGQPGMLAVVWNEEDGQLAWG